MVKIRSTPWITDGSFFFLRDYLAGKNAHVLEFGAGASTLWFDRSENVDGIISIEHDPAWYEMLKEKISGKVDLRLLPQPYNEVCKDLKSEFDVVVVDGRNRNRCFQSALPLLRSGGILVFDNTERKYYQPSFDLWNASSCGKFTRFRQVGRDITGWTSHHKEGYWETTVFEKG